MVSDREKIDGPASHLGYGPRDLEDQLRSAEAANRLGR